MRMVLALAAVLALAVVPDHPERANATVLVQNTAGTLPGPQGVYGQSATTPDGGPFTNITLVLASPIFRLPGTCSSSARNFWSSLPNS